MTSYIIRRLLLIIPTVFFALSFLFLLFFALPGDPANLIAGGADRNPNPIRLEQINEQYGLDDPISMQFVNYWKRRSTGTSATPSRAVAASTTSSTRRRQNSLRLAFWAIIIEVIVGISVGLYSAIRRYSVAGQDHHDRSPPSRRRFPSSCSASSSSTCSPSYPNKHDWPEWMRLRTSQIGPPGSGDGTGPSSSSRPGSSGAT